MLLVFNVIWRKTCLFGVDIVPANSIYLRWGEGQHVLDLFDTQKKSKFATIFCKLV